MAKKAEETSAFNAVILYKQALGEFKSLNDVENTKLCLGKIRELNQEAQKSFKQVTVTQKIPSEDIEAVVKDFRDAESIEEALKLFAFHPAFAISHDQIVKSVVEGPFIAHKICSNAVVNGKGDFVSGGSDGDQSMVMQSYFVYHGIMSQVFLTRAWDALLERGLTVEMLVAFFKDRLNLNEEVLVLLENGFSHLFLGDSIASLHVLVPRFEQLMLTISNGLGVETVALERTKEVATRDKMISKDFMQNPAVQEKFGKDFCEYVVFFLFEPLGLNLRHHLAHGDVMLRDCSFSNALSILRLLLTFPARFKVS